MSAGGNESLVFNKKPESLKQNICFAGTMDDGQVGLKKELAMTKK